MGAYLGKTLRYLRKQSGQTLEQVAERVGVSTAALSLFETGKRNPSPSVLGAIASHFNYPVDELLMQLDRERTADRWTDARNSAAQADTGIPDEALRADGWRGPERYGKVFSVEPIDALFSRPKPDSPPRAFSDEISFGSVTGSRRVVSRGDYPESGEEPVRSIRSRARHHWDVSERLQAIEALADTASVSLRTLRGLAADEDPRVRREAIRMLRELGVEAPGESAED